MLDGSVDAMPCGRQAERLAEVRQHDGQVIDVHCAVARKFALRQSSRLAEVRQHDGQIVDIHLAVQVGVARQDRLDAAASGVELDEVHPVGE